MNTRRIFSFVFSLFLTLLVMGYAYAAPVVVGKGARLGRDQAFAFSLGKDRTGALVAHWHIAPDYHLYKRRIQIQADPKSQVQIGQPLFPQGIAWHDNIMGDYVIYKGDLNVRIPVVNPGDGRLVLSVHYQGCRGTIDCYPPITKQITANINNLPLMGASVASGNRYANLLATHHMLYLLALFLGVGVLLAFTPCVLPMIPILSGIILGQGKSLSMKRAFLLTLVYVLSMSLTFAAAGVFAGYAGVTLQASLQSPIVLGLFSLVLVLLALSLFGLYELQIPAFIRHRLSSLSADQHSGSYVGAAVMGCLATLIASPCVTAPLVGLLIYISTTGNAAFGGVTLFIMGVGMGLPLLAFGTLGGKYLPRAGRWMNVVKVIFGMLLLGMAIWMGSRVVAFAYVPASHSSNDVFYTITTPDQLQEQLKIAKKKYRPVLMDYYADWCVACKEMDVGVFANDRVQKALSRFVLLKANVTINNHASHLLERTYHVFAPPSIVFFDANGKYVKGANIDGRVDGRTLMRAARKINS